MSQPIGPYDWFHEEDTKVCECGCGERFFLEDMSPGARILHGVWIARDHVEEWEDDVLGQEDNESTHYVRNGSMI